MAHKAVLDVFGRQFQALVHPNPGGTEGRQNVEPVPAQVRGASGWSCGGSFGVCGWIHYGIEGKGRWSNGGTQAWGRRSFEGEVCRTRASGRGTSAVSPSGEVNAPDNCAGVIECVTPRDSAVGDLAMRATGGPGRALRRYRCAGVHHDGRFRARFRRHLPPRRAGIGVPSCACHSQGLLQQTVVTYPSHSG